MNNIVSNRMAYLDSNAKPLAYGRLAIYNARSSTSLANVYADAKLTQLLKNPVLLDSSGRAPALFAGGSGSVYVKVEKYIGKDKHGKNRYSMVHDFETPPGVDISSYWNVNYVETYGQLRAIQNQNPTWVTGEGNPHLYVWNAAKHSNGLNEVTDVSSTFDNSGSWHWETKEVYIDQAELNNNGTEIVGVQQKWKILQTLNQYGIKIIIPRGEYYFKDLSGITTVLYNLEIMPGVRFTRLTENWKIEIKNNVVCLSKDLPITWLKLPMDRLYDIQYFASISAQSKNTVSDDSISITGNLEAKKITAQGDLSSGGSISGLGSISTEGSIVAKFDISAGGNISAAKDISADSYLYLQGRKYGDYPLAIAADANEGSAVLPVGSYATYYEKFNENIGDLGNLHKYTRPLNEAVYPTSYDASVVSLTNNNDAGNSGQMYGKWLITGLLSYMTSATTSYVFYLIRRVAWEEDI